MAQKNNKMYKDYQRELEELEATMTDEQLDAVDGHEEICHSCHKNIDNCVCISYYH